MSSPKTTSIFSPARMVFYTLSVIVFYFAARYIGKWNNIRQLLFQMSIAWLLLAVAAQLSTYLFNMLMLRILLMGETGTAGFFTLFKLSVVIMFINQALPTGGISGNGYIFRQLVKRKVPPPRVFNALILESVCYYIAFLTLLSIFYGWYLDHVPVVSPVIRYTVITGFVFFIILGIAVLLIADKQAVSFVLRKLSHFGFMKRYIAKAGLLPVQQGHADSWKALFKNKKPVILAVIFQLCILTCDLITILAIMQGFHIRLAVSRIMFGLLLTLVVGSLPVSPGSLIAYESAMTYFYTLLGVPVHAALIITLLFRFFTFWLPIPIGLLLYQNLRRQKA
ncbi:flippase-like domain-containing protein [Mucilaginibacter sp. HC2]|uniref:lysylphosphatidylglycerol synthase transmembrane domain-containing protein n=1 Tax=Mucilaginibacter inviolabilis TaxID=2714892 RepID=UPI0014076767|nr:lysylphosphatidylglycerol synthase transmembrane domain-containing protein [Mucilaginibacter inviolabilis]NHA03368.1 flippase-like domain-containing protein [Mucilaginibacter inviolabilis]